MVGAAPAGAPDGLYTVQITATLVSTPTDYRLASDIIWVGDWVAPPLGPGPRRVYLPLVVRQQ